MKRINKIKGLLFPLHYFLSDKIPAEKFNEKLDELAKEIDVLFIDDMAELREIAQAFVAVGMNLDTAECQFKQGQETTGKTHFDLAFGAYKETRRRLRKVLPEINWGLDEADYRKPMIN